MFNAIEYINTPRWQHVSLGLKRTRLLLSLLGDPQKKLKFVHIAGTNGKGSTCAFLESIFRTSGLKTGLFSSPFLMCFEDRIRVNNANINKHSLTEITLKVKKVAEGVEKELGEHPTEFELMTAVAFCHFAKEQCDVVVCEVGLGGRLDSTNVIVPEVSVITHIGLDHQSILGNTLEEIANEKAGIIKPNVPVVLAPQRDCVYPIVKKVASDLNAPLVALRKTQWTEEEGLEVSKSLTAGDFTSSQALFSNSFQSLSPLFSDFKMKGNYQKENACVAGVVAQLMGIDEISIKKGLMNATWPGRFEVFDWGSLCKVVLDGAHNVDGARALKESLCNLNMDLSTSPCSSQEGAEEVDSSQVDVNGEGSFDRIAVFGALKDKDVSGIVEEVGGLFEQFFVYEVDSPRAMKACDLASLTEKFAKTEVAISAEDALQKALRVAKKKDHQNLVVCFGSLYSLGDIRRHLLKEADC